MARHQRTDGMEADMVARHEPAPYARIKNLATSVESDADIAALATAVFDQRGDQEAHFKALVDLLSAIEAERETVLQEILELKACVEEQVLANCAAETAKADGINPPPDLPRLGDLTEWLWQGRCPEEDVDEANDRLAKLLGSDASWLWDWSDGRLFLAADFGVSDGQHQVLDLAKVQVHWDAAAGTSDRPAHPLAPLVRGWWKNRPLQVQPSRRTTGRIIPAKLAQVDPTEDSRAGRLFSFAAHSPGGQLVLAGFPIAVRGPALPLVLYDLGSGPSKPSQAAPLALRMFIEALLAVPQQERDTGRPVYYEVSLREFLAWFWPTRHPTPSEYWSALMAAREALFHCLVPLINPDTGRGQRRQIVNVGAIPEGPRALDDAVGLVVHLPAGSGNGPQLPDTLRYWGNTSASAYRALINLSFHWHNPGQSHYPVGKRSSDGKEFWAQSSDPDRYPTLSDQQLIEICYPTSQNRNRRDLLKRARRTIDKLQEAGELRLIDGKILPPVPQRAS